MPEAIGPGTHIVDYLTIKPHTHEINTIAIRDESVSLNREILNQSYIKRDIISPIS